MNPYLELTREFNEGRVRAIVSSGQAVVLHRLSIASKDGDWIVEETPEALAHLLRVLSSHGARYRFGAPLDVRWLRGGWSAHFEFHRNGLRVRTDFATRPPRVSASDLRGLWDEQVRSSLPCVDPRRLVLLKQTGRERDYAVIGELARLLEDPRDAMLASRSPADLVDLALRHPRVAREAAAARPLLAHASRGDAGALARALDEERRALMEADVRGIARYTAAAEAWARDWPAIERAVSGMALQDAHERVVEAATQSLPFDVAGPV